MKEPFYFQHDYNARNDPKLQDVLIDLGIEGIGVFWCIIEQLYEQGGTLPIRSCKSIAFALHVDCNVVERLVHDYGLFKNDGEKMWSESVLNRLNRRKDISDKRKLAALARWRQNLENQSQASIQSTDNPIINNANEMQVHTTSNASAGHKEKEIKEKNNIKESIKEMHETAKRFVPPTLEEVKARIKEMNYTFDAEAFIAFYQSKNWMVGKNKMKDWKAAMVTWQKREYEFPKRKNQGSTKKANEEW